MRSLRLPSRCRRSSCPYRGGAFGLRPFLGPSRAKTSPIVHRYITHMTVISASIMPLAALFFTLLPARFSLRALEALRWVVGGESMTTPGGTRTPCQSVPATPRARRTGFYHGVGAPTAPPLRSSGPSLCPSPMPQVRGAKLGRRECRLGRVILSVAPAHEPEEDQWPPLSTASRPEQMPSKDMTMCS